MPPRKQAPEQNFSDSDKAQLDDIRKEHEFERWAEDREAKRKAARNESFRIWAHVLTTLALAIGWLKDGILWLLNHLNGWLGL